MVPLFLKASREIGGLGMTNEEIGLIYGTLGTVAFIVGSILAGYYVANLGLKKRYYPWCASSTSRSWYTTCLRYSSPTTYM